MTQLNEISEGLQTESLKKRHRIRLAQNVQRHLRKKQFLLSRFHSPQGITRTRALSGGNRGEHIIGDADTTVSQGLGADKGIQQHAACRFFAAIKAL
jgi:hypothetical protein